MYRTKGPCRAFGGARRWRDRISRKAVGRLAFAALLGLFGATGTAEAAETRETVVVTGHRMSDQEASSAISSFVAAHTKFTVIKQLARWRVPACPKVLNLPPAYGAFIVARIKTLARSVRAPVAEPCEPNVTIIYTPHPQAVMDEIALHKPDLLGFHFNSQRKALATVTRPIQAWYVTATNDVVDNAYRPRPPGTPGSRLSNGSRSEFVHVLVVVNSDAVGGFEVGPVADYIAMLVLSQASDPDDCTQLPTILSYLSPECPADYKPDSLTASDRAYLEGLYSISPEAFGTLQRSGIFNRMTRNLDEPAAEAEPAARAQ